MQYLHFEILQNTIESNAKKLTLQLDIHQLDQDQIETLQDNLKSYKGDKPLFFNIYDTDKKVKLMLNSKKQKVNITPDLLQYLDEKAWHYKLN
jgi:DNA polymerase-3 subunit alpha